MKSPHDFAGMIDELRELGMSQTAIAEDIGTSQALVSQLQSGKVRDPKFSIGWRLKRLHTERKAKDLQEQVDKLNAQVERLNDERAIL